MFTDNLDLRCSCRFDDLAFRRRGYRANLGANQLTANLLANLLRELTLPAAGIRLLADAADVLQSGELTRWERVGGTCGGKQADVA